MSKVIDKHCPLCGGLIKLHTGDVHSCSSCPFKCFEDDFDRVCAAMELAQALMWEEEVEDFISNMQHKGKTIRGLNLVNIRNKAEDLSYDAEVRVRELFK